MFMILISVIIIQQKAASLFYDTLRQVSSLKVQLLMGGVFCDPRCGEGEVVGGQRWHHSKERWRFL